MRKIKRDDNVLVLAGKDRGKTGVVRAVIGGGDLIVPWRSGDRYWSTDFLRRPVHVIGVGVPTWREPKPAAMRVLRGFLQHGSVRSITARDEESAAWIREHLEPRVPVAMAADLVFALTLPPVTRPDGPPKMSVGRHDVRALQFLRDDDRQLVQVRLQGFSFNRLSPYSSLDDYMTDIEDAWHTFVKVTSPVQITAIRLRYINRLLIPLVGGELNLEKYLKTAPQMPKGVGLKLVGFLNHHVAVETDTGHQVNIVLAAQAPEAGVLPVIFDNTAASLERGDPHGWPWIRAKIQDLRVLKNRVFRETLTESCLSLFQQP